MLRAFGDGNLFGEAYGEGPVQVVWLHGWARRGADFAAAAGTLATRGVASVAFDLPGFGATPPPATPGGARQYAELLAPAIAQLTDGPVVLVGHSFGGRVATVLAATRPELVRALVLTGVPLIRRSGPSRSPLRYRVVRWLHGRGVLGDDRMEAARQRYGSTDYRNASGIVRDVLVISVNESYEDELAMLRVPVSMVWGADDTEVPVEVARLAQVSMDTTPSLRVVPGVGHMLPLEDPASLVECVLAVMS